jgi:uncharacterized membrane protein
MLTLLIGLVLFFAVHAVPMDRDIRDGLVARLGAGPYRLAFSAIAALGLVLIVAGMHKLQLNPGKNPELWHPPIWMRHISFTLMLPAFVLLVAAYVPSRIRTLAKHPMLAAVKIWAFSHLLANGDLASIILFGSFLAWAVIDRFSAKRRGAMGPLGNVQPGSPINDVIVVVVGVALYAGMMIWGHRLLIGVPLFAH